jgi:hypothetical protein
LDDFDDIFGEKESVAASAITSVESVEDSKSINVETNNNNLDIETKLRSNSDFFSWLDDTDTSRQVLGSLFPETSNTTIPSNGSQMSTILSPATVDTFFDEVFGNDTNTYEVQTNFVPDVKSVVIEDKHDDSVVNIELELYDVIHATFPDVNRLRHLLQRCGYIMKSKRYMI